MLFILFIENSEVATTALRYVMDTATPFDEVLACIYIYIYKIPSNRLLPSYTAFTTPYYMYVCMFVCMLVCIFYVVYDKPLC